MKPCVVDASVVAAAFFHEEHAEPACALIVSGRELHAPDLIYAEVGNVIWKHQKRREIDENEASQLLADFLGLPLKTTPDSLLIEHAMKLAVATGQTVYDSLYLALAVTAGSVLVTADRRLVHALTDGPLANRILHIAEYR